MTQCGNGRDIEILIPNLAEYHIHKYKFDDYTINSNLSVTDYGSLGETIRELKENANLSHKFNVHDVHHYFMFYFFVAAVVVVCAVILLKSRKMKKYMGHGEPVPATRKNFYAAYIKR